MRGLGHTYKRNDVWWVSYYSHGTRYRETSGSRSQSDAIALLRKRLGEIGKGTHTALQSAAHTTFQDLIDKIYTDYEINSRKDTKRMKSCVSNLTQYFHPGMLATEITTARLHDYVAMRHRVRQAPATIQRELAIMGRMLTLGLQHGLIAFKPKLPTIKVNNARKGFISFPELLRLQDALPLWFRGPILYAYYSGWRIGEILNLKWGEVDRSTLCCKLASGTTKSGEGRTFPYGPIPELVQLIEAQWVNRNGPYVFHKLGNFIRDYRREWASATRSAGILGALVHDLRRSAIRNFEQAGIPRTTAMKLSGHRTESVYRRYAIVSQQDMEDGLKKLEALKHE